MATIYDIRGSVAHAGCDTCDACFDGARSVMQVTGSREVTHRDGIHFGCAVRVAEDEDFAVGDSVRFVDETKFGTITETHRTAAGLQYIIDFGPDSYVIGAYAPIITKEIA